MIYLDNSAASWPKPESVYRAMDEFARNHAGNPAATAHRMAVAAAEKVRECRSRIAGLVNAESPDRIVLTSNATDAIHLALRGFLREGDHVVTSHLEHKAVAGMLEAMERAGFITIDRARSDTSGIVPPEEVRHLLRRETRLLAITHCSNVLGQVNPIAEYGRIAAHHGARILVDASQTTGVVPIDVQAMGLDLVAFPGYKNLFGPMGTGALYVREGLPLEVFHEQRVGYAIEESMTPPPFRLEGGTPNVHGCAGLAAGVQFVQETGVERIRRHVQGLALAFLDRLKEIEGLRIYSGRVPEAQIGAVSITFERAEPGEAASTLDRKYGIACRPGLHCNPGTHRFLGTHPRGTVRFSFGFFNTPADAEAAATAVREIAEAL